MEFKTNIEKDTIENNYYRKVIHTGSQMQLVLMSLKVGEDIPSEVHHDIDQFIRIESGNALAIIDNKKYELKDDDIIIIPAGANHQIINSSKTKELKLYSIYSPPEHAPGTIHKTREDAEKAEHHH